MGSSVHQIGRYLILCLAALLAALDVPAQNRPLDPPHDWPETRRPIVGVALNVHHVSNLQVYLRGIDQIREMGANALIVLTPLFQHRVDSTDIRHLRYRCPSDRQLITLLDYAREKGLRTTLMPIVLIEDPGEDDWRGVIRPTHWEAWWRSYNRLIDRFVEIAREAEVDILSIGSELNSTEDQTERWRRIVQRVRRNFPGRITYSANWDRYHAVPFWEIVDFIGISSYFELERDRPGAPLDDLVASWARERDRLLRFARRHDRPLLMTEVGYPSLPWANAHPWNYVANGESADHEAQARCWQAFFHAWTEKLSEPEGPAAGFFAYHWDPHHAGGAYDTGYGFRGKPSDQVLRDGFTRILDR